MQYPLGVILKNETKHEDMQKIMLHLLQYVPVATTENSIIDPADKENVKIHRDVFHHILFGGNQLMVERAIGVKSQCSNETPMVCGLVADNNKIVHRNYDLLIE